MNDRYYRIRLFHLTAKLGTVFLLYIFFIIAIAKASDTQPLLEDLINDQIATYPFDADNQFKLAAYAELKGRYHNESESFVLNFGKLGTLSFFPDHCLLKVGADGYLSLDRKKMDVRKAIEVNIALNQLFEQINLLANHGADREHIAFINQHLAKKNLDPFDKIYTRHLLIKYGRYDAKRQAMMFHTDWLPKELTSADMVKQYRIPLGMKLDSASIRGYYLGIGGEVFVNNVARHVSFATGEDASANVTAFKVFVQKLFTQTVQHLPKETKAKPVTRSASSDISSLRLYGPDDWITMMLGILRSHNTNIGDSDVIHYFKDQPCFPHIYAQMTVEERAAADRSLGK